MVGIATNLNGLTFQFVADATEIAVKLCLYRRMD